MTKKDWGFDLNYSFILVVYVQSIYSTYLVYIKNNQFIYNV